MEKRELLKLIYLYLFSAIGLIVLIIGSVKLLDLGLRTFVFKSADVYYMPKITPVYPEGSKLSPEEWQREIEEQQKAEEVNRKSQRQREISNSLAMIFVGAPLYLYHWRLVLKNKKESNS